MADPPGRAPRRDGIRNRERLLEAARTLFASRGADVALEEIARVAHVSRTTLYRHFTSREGLAAVLAEEQLAVIERHAAQLLDDSRGAIELFDHVLRVQFESRFVTTLLPRDDAHFVEIARRTANAFAPLVALGRRAGTVRAGVDEVDVLLALQTSETFARSADVDDRSRRHARGRRLLLHGLFADEAVEAHEHS